MEALRRWFNNLRAWTDKSRPLAVVLEQDMDLQERIQIVYRLMSNTTYISIGDKEYVLKNPTIDDLYASSRLYSQALRDNKYNEWLTNKKCQNILESIGLWNDQNQNNLEQVEKRLEDYKVDLYEASLFKTSKIDRIKKQLVGLKKSIDNMYQIKHSLDSNTIEGYAHVISQQYLITRSAYNADGRRVFGGDIFMNGDTKDAMITSFINKFAENRLSIGVVRGLVRTEPWRGYWGIGKPNPFDCKISELNDDQRACILYAKMYDNIFESPDCPSETVINDDDMLDGWMIKQRREREKDKETQEAENVIGGNHGNADSIFVPVANKEEAQKINSLNNTHAQMIKKQRENIIKQRKEVREGQFPDQMIGKEKQKQEQFKGHQNG